MRVRPSRDRTLLEGSPRRACRGLIGAHRAGGAAYTLATGGSYRLSLTRSSASRLGVSSIGSALVAVTVASAPGDAWPFSISALTELNKRRYVQNATHLIYAGEFRNGDKTLGLMSAQTAQAYANYGYNAALGSRNTTTVLHLRDYKKLFADST
jgi:hypothetical protein